MLVNKFTQGHWLLVCSFLRPFFIYTPEREFLLLSPPPCLLWSSEKEQQTMAAGGWPGCACCGCVGFLLVVGGHAGRRGISHGFDLFFYLFIYRLCLFQFFQGVFIWSGRCAPCPGGGALCWAACPMGAARGLRVRDGGSGQQGKQELPAKAQG